LSPAFRPEILVGNPVTMSYAVPHDIHVVKDVFDG